MAFPCRFGPHTDNFREIVGQLSAADAATVVRDELDLENFVRKVVDQPGWATGIGVRGQKVVLQHDGAADRSVSQLFRLLDQSAGTSENNPAAKMNAA